MTTVTFGDLSFELRHSSKRRTVGITVERDGHLILAVPPEMSEDVLEKIVADKRFWIYSKLVKKESYAPPAPTKEYVTGKGFYYLGRSYRLKLVHLKLVDHELQQVPLKLYQGRFELHQPCQAQARELFIVWYRQHLKPILDQQIAALIHRVGAAPHSVQIRELGFRWGSCGSKGDVYFHWRVAMLPRLMVEYVVTHELVHLVEPNHSGAFWERIERIMPDYNDRKQWLAKNGAAYDL